MGSFNRIILMITMSVGIALLLMWMVQGQQKSKQADQEAYTHLNQLSDQNLVDYMVKLPLKLQIAKVSWQHAILSVDLLSVPGTTIDTMVYDDMFELSQFGLNRLTNVNQVLIRIIEHKATETNRNELLLAMDSRKENAQSLEDGAKELSSIDRQRYLQSHYNLTYTQKWKEQFVD